MNTECRRCGNMIRVPEGAVRPPAVCAECMAMMRPAMIKPLKGNKKALLIGVNYKGTPHELKGCANDVGWMNHLLISKFNFPESSILTLTEDETEKARLPTKRNIERAIRWLIQGCRRGDSLVFHFSGHGLFRPDHSGDEIDGYDETLLPLDFETAGQIVDDKLNLMLVRPLPQGVKLHAIIDACHSGTVLDLPFVCKLSGEDECEWEDHRPMNGVWKGTSGGEAISFTACSDDQTALDSKALSQVRTGATTSSFVRAVENGEATTYGSLLSAMHKYVHEARQTQGKNKIQEPQLCSSYPFHAHEKMFYL